jgi:threonine synthase
MAFEDEVLRKKVNLSSANSISIARLLPQAVYYIYAFMNLYEKHDSINFVVPSGNLGNITAGLLTKFAGMPVKRFYSALNKNDVFANYLTTGTFTPQPTIQTISNAMDVGSPSNLERIVALYHGDIDHIRRDVSAKSYSDEETLAKIGEIYRDYQYLVDPHTAVGMLYADELTKMSPKDHFVVMSTAHPAKFYEDVKSATGADFTIPKRLSACLSEPKVSRLIGTGYDEFKEIIGN